MQLESGRERLHRDQAQAEREGMQDVHKLDLTRNLAVAGQSAPQLVNTGTTGTQQGTVTQSESPVATIGKFVSSAAPLSL